MTNFEKWKDEILEITSKRRTIAVVNGQPCVCHMGRCGNCDFRSTSCISEMIEWLYEEYKEPTPKLTKRERAFLEFIESGYLARDEDGDLFWYENKPLKSHDEYHIDHGAASTINNKLRTFFPFIKWTDEKPWSIEDLLKLEVEND